MVVQVTGCPTTALGWHRDPFLQPAMPQRESHCTARKRLSHTRAPSVLRSICHSPTTHPSVHYVSCLSTQPSVHQPTHPFSQHPPTHPSIHPPSYPSICPPINPLTHPPVCPSIHLPVCLSAHPPTHPPVCPSTHLSVHPPLCPSTHPPFICSSIHHTYTHTYIQFIALSFRLLLDQAYLVSPVLLRAASLVAFRYTASNGTQHVAGDEVPHSCLRPLYQPGVCLRHPEYDARVSTSKFLKVEPWDPSRDITVIERTRGSG